MNTPRNPVKTIPETQNLPLNIFLYLPPNLPLKVKDVYSKKSVKRIIDSETFNHSVSKKMKIESLKTEIITFLESTISFLFQKEKITLN